MSTTRIGVQKLEVVAVHETTRHTFYSVSSFDRNLVDLLKSSKVCDESSQLLTGGHKMGLRLLQPVNTSEYRDARSLLQDRNKLRNSKGAVTDIVVKYLLQEMPIEQLITDPELLNQLEIYLQENNPALLKNPGSTVLDQQKIQEAVEDAVKQEIIVELSKIRYSDLVADPELRNWVKQQLEALLPHIVFEQLLSERGYAEQLNTAIEDAISKEIESEQVSN